MLNDNTASAEWHELLGHFLQGRSIDVLPCLGTSRCQFVQAKHHLHFALLALDCCVEGLLGKIRQTRPDAWRLPMEDKESQPLVQSLLESGAPNDHLFRIKAAMLVAKAIRIWLADDAANPGCALAKKRIRISSANADVCELLQGRDEVV